MGNTTVPITFENSEDTSKTNPNIPMEDICHVTAIQIRVIIYDTLPFWYSFISLSKVLHSPLANNPTTQTHVAMNEGSIESSESELTASREADMVRRTTELNMNAVNFWEFRKKENNALKANWVAHSRE
ncbi:hypothetical protein SESBI_08640 [Sesbania bispinosa]|nr:hypothetical protein SESBI_08640 [Sesbania bispinosa]